MVMVQIPRSRCLQMTSHNPVMRGCEHRPGNSVSPTHSGKPRSTKREVIQHKKMGFICAVGTMYALPDSLGCQKNLALNFAFLPEFWFVAEKSQANVW